MIAIEDIFEKLIDFIDSQLAQESTVEITTHRYYDLLMGASVDGLTVTILHKPTKLKVFEFGLKYKCNEATVKSDLGILKSKIKIRMEDIKAWTTR